MLSDTKKAVLFDFGDTLAATNPTYAVRLTMALKALGHDVDNDELLKAYIYTDYELFAMYKSLGGISNEQYLIWFYRNLFCRLNINGNKRSIYDAMVGAMREIHCNRHTLPGAVELLKALKQSGIALAIVSNNDGRTAKKCEELGIRDYFDFITDSTQVGCTKPDRRIFNLTLRKLGITPDEAIHVGDLWGADVLGGLNAGLDVIWLNRRPVEKPEDLKVPQASSLGEIKEMLGV